jgi:hypothetical protein
MRETPRQWKTCHVLGHQLEKGKERQALDRWEILNDEMDAAAKLHRRLFADHETAVRPQYLFRESCAISIAGTKYSSDILAELRWHINGRPLLDYWKSKGKFDETTELTIDWSATLKAMKALPLPRRIHQSKMVSTFVGAFVGV